VQWSGSSAPQALLTDNQEFVWVKILGTLAGLEDLIESFSAGLERRPRLAQAQQHAQACAFARFSAGSPAGAGAESHPFEGAGVLNHRTHRIQAPVGVKP
jgi:hypothetical protein